MSDNCDLRDFIDELSATGEWVQLFGQLLSAIAATLRAEQRQKTLDSEALLEERVWQLEQQLRTMLEGLQQATTVPALGPQTDSEHAQKGGSGPSLNATSEA